MVTFYQAAHSYFHFNHLLPSAVNTICLHSGSPLTLQVLSYSWLMVLPFPSTGSSTWAVSLHLVCELLSSCSHSDSVVGAGQTGLDTYGGPFSHKREDSNTQKKL